MQRFISTIIAGSVCVVFVAATPLVAQQNSEALEYRNTFDEEGNAHLAGDPTDPQALLPVKERQKHFTVTAQTFGQDGETNGDKAEADGAYARVQIDSGTNGQISSIRFATAVVDRLNRLAPGAYRVTVACDMAWDDQPITNAKRKDLHGFSVQLHSDARIGNSGGNGRFMMRLPVKASGKRFHRVSETFELTVADPGADDKPDGTFEQGTFSRLHLTIKGDARGADANKPEAIRFDNLTLVIHEAVDG